MDYKIRIRAIAGYGNEEWALASRMYSPAVHVQCAFVTLPAANDTISLQFTYSVDFVRAPVFIRWDF